MSAELLEATFEIYQHGFKGANVELPFIVGIFVIYQHVKNKNIFLQIKTKI